MSSFTLTHMGACPPPHADAAPNGGGKPRPTILIRVAVPAPGHWRVRLQFRPRKSTIMNVISFPATHAKRRRASFPPSPAHLRGKEKGGWVSTHLRLAALVLVRPHPPLPRAPSHFRHRTAENARGLRELGVLLSFSSLSPLASAQPYRADERGRAAAGGEAEQAGPPVT